ncbi:FAD-binding protein [Acidiphilium sp.]|uniref:FAD-binding protein n=1 Tax=Acidiphilium sp. TaxID=527 RepID=UPI0025885460|nr:FAD-binding protein [Acidiphilium sp.]
MIAPSDEAGLVAAIEAAAASHTPLTIEGLGSKAGFARPVQTAETLSTRNLTGIPLHAPQELIVSARAGTTLAALEAKLAEAGQHLIAEPPHYAFLGAEAQTVGGIIATNLSGPRRIAWGAMRDHVMGIRAVTGRAEVIRSGGRVLKNVTGLDLCKLFTGSYGTLGVMSEITLKVLPAPEATGTVVLAGLDAATAVKALSAALGSPFSVTGAAHLPEGAAAALGHARPITIARIEDFTDSVHYRIGRLAEIWGAFGMVEQLDTSASLALWRAVRDAAPLAVREGDAVWRISVRPSAGPSILEAAQAAGLDGYLDWGGGLVFLSGPGDEAAHAAIANAARRAGGEWWLLRAPDALRHSPDALPREPDALAAIRRRVTAAFDPAGILNPGRLHAA